MQPEKSFKRRQHAAVDVCRRSFVQFVQCDVPCTEGYGPENLVSNSFVDRSKGFLAERFIKPPVTLELIFKSEIDIKYIVINCTVGAQRTKGVEISTKVKSSTGNFEYVASGVLPDDKKGFVFYRFDENLKEKFGDQFYFRTFKSSKFLSVVQSLKVKIFRTCGVSVPALGKVEVWGIPHKYDPNSIKFKCIKDNPSVTEDMGPLAPSIEDSELLLSNKNVFHTEDNAEYCKSTTNTKLKTPVIAKINPKVTVPDDFIDPITCEIMIQPVVLPSGKTVDNSTLESFKAAELKWGRGPSDPFTGVTFSDFSKPIAAIDLKARIDKFLSDNCNSIELAKVPRTLGGSKESNLSVSKLVTRTKMSLCASYTPASTNENIFGRGLKRKNPEVHPEFCQVQNRMTESECRVSLQTSENVFKLTRPNPNSKFTNKPNPFQESMEQSLELALKSTLSKLPKLTGDKSLLVEKTPASCCECRSTNNLFGIPCDHFVCRGCLVSSKRNEPKLCSVCMFQYKSNDVQKVHLSKL